MSDNLKSKIGWKFTGESKMFEGRKVFQIRSLKDFHQQGRKVGDLDVFHEEDPSFEDLFNNARRV